MLVIESIVNRLEKHLNSIDNSIEINELNDINNKLMELLLPIDAWLEWFYITQKSNYKTSTFRWLGRSINDNKVIPNTLSSGLDDYPRSSYPTDSESHLDLQSWLTKSSEIINKLCNYLKENRKNSHNNANEMKLIDKILNKHEIRYTSLYQRLHDSFYYSNITTSTSKTSKSITTTSISTSISNTVTISGYYDIGLYSNNTKFELYCYVRCVNPLNENEIQDIQVPVYLVNTTQPANPCPLNYSKPLLIHKNSQTNHVHMIEILLQETIDNMTLNYIPRIGYNNIFPFLLKLIPIQHNTVDAKNKLLKMLDMIEDTNGIWSDYGLRSLSKSDMFYKKRNAPGDAPYWRLVSIVELLISIQLIVFLLINYFV